MRHERVAGQHATAQQELQILGRGIVHVERHEVRCEDRVTVANALLDRGSQEPTAPHFEPTLLGIGHLHVLVVLLRRDDGRAEQLYEFLDGEGLVFRPAEVLGFAD